jgi:hypothetical protein
VAVYSPAVVIIDERGGGASGECKPGQGGGGSVEGSDGSEGSGVRAAEVGWEKFGTQGCSEGPVCAWLLGVSVSKNCLI